MNKNLKFQLNAQGQSLYIKELCVICQKEGGKLRKVAVKSTGKRMVDVAKCLSSKDFFLQLNVMPLAEDAIANDVGYHLKCWVAIQRQDQNDILNEKIEIQELKDVNRVIADIEIVEMVRESVNSNVIDMNTVNLTYNALLENKEEINCKKILSHFCKAMLQMLYFQDLHVEENQRIFIVTSLTKSWLLAKILQRDIKNL